MQGLRSPPARALDSQAWQRLLEFLAASGPDPSQAYERMRTRLVKFFGWRGVRTADELVDETLTRVAMKLPLAQIEGDRPAAFVLGVARLVFLEWMRRESRWERLDDVEVGAAVPAAQDAQNEWLAALEQCLQRLPQEERRLLLRYHEATGQERGTVRQAIADELAISLGALRVRMHRVRLQLEGCVRERLVS
jgi:RNA polymerase sigma factor (sigma-70 family)